MEIANVGRRVSGAQFCVAAKLAASAVVVHSGSPLTKCDYIYATVLSIIRRMRWSCACVKYIRLCVYNFILLLLDVDVLHYFVMKMVYI